MKRFFNKRNKSTVYQTVNQFFQTSKFLSLQSIALLTGLPYLIWELFAPDINWSKWSKFFSGKLRKILEFKKTRHAVGLNLATILLIFSIIQLPFAMSEVSAGNVEIKLEKPDITTIATITENTFRMPVKGYISQYFSGFHRGIDVAGNDNANIYPISAGKVAEVAYSPFGYGLSVVVDHGNGFISRYAHLSHISVELDQEIDKHTSIGNVGSTGWSTGPHLHLEIFQNNVPVNPLAYISSEYKEGFVASQTVNNVVIAQDNAKESVMASMSAQIEHREVIEDFTDPNDILFSK